MWAYRTIPKSTTGETPFKLANGTEAVIPMKVGSISFRINYFNEQVNSEGIRLNLDLSDEARELALTQIAEYQLKIAQYYDQRVKPWAFK